MKIITKGEIKTITNKCCDCETVFTYSKKDVIRHIIGYKEKRANGMRGVIMGNTVDCPFCNCTIILK